MKKPVKQHLIHHLIQMSGEASKTVSPSPVIQMSEEASKTVSPKPFNSDE